MRLPFGYEFSVSKAARGTVNADGSARLQQMASALADPVVGTAAAAYGTRPNPGVTPDATQDLPPDPLRYQFPWGGNLTYTPRTGYGTPFAILRNLVGTSPVCQLCVTCRQDQMAALDWGIAAKDKKRKDKSIDRQIEQAHTFLAKPDGVASQKTWLQTAVDEILTVDALSIYKRPTRGGAPERSPDLNTSIYGYELIDGSTIKVLVDPGGFIPQPPNVAYRQIIYGAPMAGGDFTADQLLYRPKTVRTWTPYGRPPIESALLIVLSELHRNIFNLSYYSEGNIPEAMVGVPDSWQPLQVRQWQEYWDLLLAGDPKNRSKIRFVTETMAKTIHEFRKADFSTEWDLHILKLMCACYGVTPSEIGFTDDVNKATSKTQGDVNQRRGIKPMANFLKAIQDEMLLDLGLADVEVTWAGGEGEDALTQAKIIDLKLRSGRIGLDEQRQEDGLPTLGAGPAVYTPTGPVFIEQALKQAKEVDQVDTKPAAKPAPKPTPADTVAQDAELKKYQTVALKAVKRGKPVPAFQSTILSPDLQTAIAKALVTVQTSEDVHEVFTQARVRKAAEGRRPSALQQRQTRRMEKSLTRTLSDMGEAFESHLRHGLAQHTEKAETPSRDDLVLKELAALRADMDTLKRQPPAPSGPLVAFGRPAMRRRVEYNTDSQIVAIHEEPMDGDGALKLHVTPPSDEQVAS